MKYQKKKELTCFLCLGLSYHESKHLLMSDNNASGTDADSAFVNAEVSMPRLLRFWL